MTHRGPDNSSSYLNVRGDSKIVVLQGKQIKKCIYFLSFLVSCMAGYTQEDNLPDLSLCGK